MVLITYIKLYDMLSYYFDNSQSHYTEAFHYSLYKYYIKAMHKDTTEKEKEKACSQSQKSPLPLPF